MQFESFLQVFERGFFSPSLARDIQLDTLSHEPLSFLPDDSRKFS
jgi:hypothetical protein